MSNDELIGKQFTETLDEALELQEALEVLQPEGNPETLLGRAEEACHAIVALHDMWEQHDCCQHHHAVLCNAAMWLLSCAKKNLQEAGDEAARSTEAN